MNFQIKFGDMEALLKKRFIQEHEPKSPVFYFEDESEISVYIPQRYTIYSTISKEKIKDLIAFKQEFLSKATELVEKPGKKPKEKPVEKPENTFMIE